MYRGNINGKVQVYKIYQANTSLFFVINGKQYNVNSKIERGQKETEQICILFLPLAPSINKPLNNTAAGACNCNH